ncbi:STM4015 family protein [Nonomuraea purpurea]|uniref:STM4015 family protein n=1 Tax=Nonomuraea purpurea TaxID=1849276 RepID=A0ABV8GHK5_9ACTN
MSTIDYRRHYAGLPTIEVRELPDDSWLSDSATVAWRISATPWSRPPKPIGQVLDAFFERADTSLVTAIVIGPWGDPSESSKGVIERLSGEAERLPALRSLCLGDIDREESEISWIQQSDITPLLQAFPQLERLDVRGGTGLALTPVRHESLRVLRIETGGLHGAVTRAVAAGDLAALEDLELWFGVEDYGGSTTVSDLEPILRGDRLPALRHLGLQNAEFQDDIAAAVATAPIVARLETLALSMGGLTDAGAEALLTGQPLTHLRQLDLHHHDLSDAMMRRLTEALAGVEVDLSEHGAPYVAVEE